MHHLKDDLVVTRLCALWALTEVSLGGLLHAMRIPLTGLLVGTSALACLYLIARSSKSRTTLLKSLLIVAAIKLAATPHASPFAYLAMFVQTLCMIPLVGRSGQNRVLVVAMFALASIYSPLQKIATLYITFGSDGILSVLDAVVSWLNPPISAQGFVVVPIMAWFGVHLLVGMLVAVRLHGWIGAPAKDGALHKEWLQSGSTSDWSAPKPKATDIGHLITFFAVLGLAVLYAYSNRLPDWVHLAWRPLLIIIVWQLAIKPIAQKLYSALIQRSSNPGSVNMVLSEIPRMWSILVFAKLKSSQLDGWLARARMFFHVTVTLAIVQPEGVNHD